MIQNPLTNRNVKVGSTTYKKLLKEGMISEYKNPPFVDLPVHMGVENLILSYINKVCCKNDSCSNVRKVCCIHGDQRTLISVGGRVYAWTEGYNDGQGNTTTLEYAWKNYCPSCFSKCHRDTRTPDIRVWMLNKSGWHTSNATQINHG